MSAASVVGVGNAIVDVIGQVGHDFIDEFELTKSAMTLIDEDRANALTDAMPHGEMASGGSAANTMVGVASFGEPAAYLGKVRDDEIGAAFIRDIRAAGVGYDVAPAPAGAATGRCLIQVTPDGERTMNTFLGASSMLTVGDLDEELIGRASVLYCEGYLWDLEDAKEAIRVAMDMAHENGVTASFTLSDSFAVDRHGAEWPDLISDRVDLLFGNIDEATAITGTETLEGVIEAVRQMTETACITMGREGSVIVTAHDVIKVPIVDIVERVDTTGAGDLYASGVLVGLAQGRDLETCGRMGNCAAAEIISHIGARPFVNLAEHCAY